MMFTALIKLKKQDKFSVPRLFTPSRTFLFCGSN